MDAYVDSLPYPADACGIIVATGGAFMAMDLVDRPTTLEHLWPRLVTWYAMDALGEAGASDAVNRTFTAKASTFGRSIPQERPRIASLARAFSVMRASASIRTALL